MEVTKVLLADYASHSIEKKLNVMGIFSQINALNFPATHPQMYLIFMWEANKSESNKRKEVEIKLMDSDGKQLFSLNGEFHVPGTGTPGKKIYGQHILALNNVKFEKPGDYAFHILINGDDKGHAPFEVTKVNL